MECIEFIKDYLDEGNIGPFLQTAINFSLEEVKKEILKYISDNGKDCFQSKHFLSWSEECLMVILKALSNDLKTCNISSLDSIVPQEISSVK
jgi:hypothetical protein